MPTLNFLDPNNDDFDNQDNAIGYLLSVVECEYHVGIPRVFVGGYSPGAAVSLLATLHGLTVIKGWVARNETTIAQSRPFWASRVLDQCIGLESDIYKLEDRYQNTPIFWRAGCEDDIVTLSSNLSFPPILCLSPESQ